jgi:hypothetical protein
MNRHAMAAVLAALTLGILGCGREGGPVSALLAPTSASEEGRVGLVGATKSNPAFDPSQFVPGVSHPYLPLVPGSISRFRSQTETNDVEVLKEHKVILGVEATVVHDQVFVDGVLIEDTLDWYAQDQEGNVWYMGEDSKSYENGVVVSTEGSWEAGVNGGEAGIIMEAHPRVADRYRQEFAAGVAEDMASVKSLDKQVTVPYGSFDHCIQTMEYSRLAPGDRGYKYYAEGVGLVLEVAPRGGHERSELISVTGP